MMFKFCTTRSDQIFCLIFYFVFFSLLFFIFVFICFFCFHLFFFIFYLFIYFLIFFQFIFISALYRTPLQENNQLFKILHMPTQTSDTFKNTQLIFSAIFKFLKHFFREMSASFCKFLQVFASLCKFLQVLQGFVLFIFLFHVFCFCFFFILFLNFFY